MAIWSSANKPRSTSLLQERPSMRPNVLLKVMPAMKKQHFRLQQQGEFCVNSLPQYVRSGFVFNTRANGDGCNAAFFEWCKNNAHMLSEWWLMAGTGRVVCDDALPCVLAHRAVVGHDDDIVSGPVSAVQNCNVEFWQDN
eukprot:8197611-Pyramimonas_sp.AAC.1